MSGPPSGWTGISTADDSSSLFSSLKLFLLLLLYLVLVVLVGS